MYGDYYGDTGTSDSYPKYNVSNSLGSLAGSAIASTANLALNPEQATKLRKEATVVCNVTTYPKCLEMCLFDVYNDPCETTDLSDERVDVSINLVY